jgi:SAM-dependent methyltransferase
MAKNTTRFSNRVEDYVKYRPGYPVEIVTYLQDAYGLDQSKLIADIGAGTGISSGLFLNSGYEVFAVEPNLEMRNKAVELLSSFPDFKAIAGSAENTGLESHSIDAVVAGQAFHWFDRDKARREFDRILKANGLTVLIWNERKSASDFEIAYDQFIVKHATDYTTVDHRNIDTAAITGFYSPGRFELKVFGNEQVFDFEGLRGRLLSSSYIPTADDPGYTDMITDLKILFDHYHENGLITINYDTKVYIG